MKRDLVRETSHGSSTLTQSGRQLYQHNDTHT